MLIISGDIVTLNGIVAIEDLRVGDFVIDNTHIRHEVTKINKKSTDTVMYFANNKAILSSDTILITAYGSRSVIDSKKYHKLMGQEIIMPDFDFKNNEDVVFLQKKKAAGFEIVLKDGWNIFVNGFNVRC